MSNSLLTIIFDWLVCIKSNEYIIDIDLTQRPNFYEENKYIIDKTKINNSLFKVFIYNENILNSDYQNIELIIVNDCSTDKTNDILSEYSIHENIKIINLVIAG